MKEPDIPRVYKDIVAKIANDMFRTVQDSKTDEVIRISTCFSLAKVALRSVIQFDERNKNE